MSNGGQQQQQGNGKGGNQNQAKAGLSVNANASGVHIEGMTARRFFAGTIVDAIGFVVGSAGIFVADMLVQKLFKRFDDGKQAKIDEANKQRADEAYKQRQANRDAAAKQNNQQPVQKPAQDSQPKVIEAKAETPVVDKKDSPELVAENKG